MPLFFSIFISSSINFISNLFNLKINIKNNLKTLDKYWGSMIKYNRICITSYYSSRKVNQIPRIEP